MSAWRLHLDCFLKKKRWSLDLPCGRIDTVGLLSSVCWEEGSPFRRLRKGSAQRESIATRRNAPTLRLSKGFQRECWCV